MVETGAVVWLTGLPATGKTTIARILERELAVRGVATLMLDSDDLREVLTPRPTYSDEERDLLYAAIGHLAELGAKGGAVVLVAATAPKRAYRDRVRACVERFVEVLLICAPEGPGEARSEAVVCAAASPELVFDSGRSWAIDIAREILDELERNDVEETHYFSVTSVPFQ